MVYENLVIAAFTHFALYAQAPHAQTGSLWYESTVDRWILPTRGNEESVSTAWWYVDILWHIFSMYIYIYIIIFRFHDTMKPPKISTNKFLFPLTCHHSRKFHNASLARLETTDCRHRNCRIFSHMRRPNLNSTCPGIWIPIKTMRPWDNLHSENANTGNKTSVLRNGF